LFAAQYETLGQADRFAYAVHEGGDTMPADRVVAYFKHTFGL
jgi:hypothetical protein